MSDYHKPRKPKDEILSYIKINYNYNPNTGLISDIRLNRVVGFYQGKYFVVTILGKNYQVHHVAWFLYYREWPAIMIDHEDQDKLNNKIDNLRLGTKDIQYSNRPKRSTNLSYINESDFGKGIYERKGRYEVYVVRNKKRHYLGVFYKLEDAQAAVKAFNDKSS